MMVDVATRPGGSSLTGTPAPRADMAAASGIRPVVDAMDELGNLIHRTVGAFTSKRPGFVAALLPSLDHANHAAMARGMRDAIDGSGLELLLGVTEYAPEKEERLLDSLLMRRPEALVLAGVRHTERAQRRLASAGVPLVETWDASVDSAEHVVGVSNAAAMRALVGHLYDHGYRRIGYIGGTTNRDACAAERRLGYLAAVEDLGLDRGRLIALGQPPNTMEQGGDALLHLLDRWPETDAVVCASDLFAFGALMTCARRDWPVPARVAIAGFGDCDLARGCVPRLTTVAVDAYRLGHRTGDVLLRAIAARRAGGGLPSETVTMPYRVVRREST